MTVVIRTMKETDCPSIRKVATSSWHATYEDIIPLEVQNRFLQQAYSDESLQIRTQKSLMLVATMEDELVGFANFSYVTQEGAAELYAIYLDPTQQNKGYGTALLEQGLSLLKDCQKLTVNVEKENKTGMQFYKAKGFEKVEEFEEQFDGHLLRTVRLQLKGIV